MVADERSSLARTARLAVLELSRLYTDARAKPLTISEYTRYNATGVTYLRSHGRVKKAGASRSTDAS